MDFNDYALECYVRDRLAHVRAVAAVRHAVRLARRHCRSARMPLVLPLIVVAGWLRRLVPTPGAGRHATENGTRT